MTSCIYYVYIYYHPDKGTPVYVGKGKGDRYKDHLTWSSNKLLRYKIKEWKSSGKKPSVKFFLKNLTECEALTIEHYLIMKYKNLERGGTLYNFSLGGGGPSRYKFDHKFYERLGQVNDSVLAEEYGCCRENVGYIRRGLGIDKCDDKPNASHPPPTYGWNKVEVPEDAVKDMHTHGDNYIARKYNLTKSVVSKERKRLSIQNPLSKKKIDVIDKANDILIFEDTLTGDVFVGTSPSFCLLTGCDRSTSMKLVKGKLKKLYKRWIYKGVYNEQ